MNEEKQTESFHPLDITALPTNKNKISLNPYMEAGVIPSHPSRSAYVGRTRSGKTNLMLTMLTKRPFYGDYFDQIYLFSGSPDEAFDMLNLPKKHVFEDVTSWDGSIKKILTAQSKIIEQIGIHKAPKILMIFEDVINHQKWLHKRKNNQFVGLHIKGRHYGISVMTTTQTWCGLPRSSRIQMDTIYYFKNPASERKKIVDEYTPSTWSKGRFAEEIVDDATAEPYNFLTIMERRPEEERYRKNLKDVYYI